MALHKAILRLMYIFVTPTKKTLFWQHFVSTMHYLLAIKMQNFK